ncbi:hypothetical protein Mgra_00003331 [Meloidogyne graminicola]|uniref:Translocation protein SEC62 n=1 Tax=Meloidogyne graminicola TaxID=189291 RepID=A0A8S9ZV76_9BILA|nr:hypothetical protein Mgra_00003331 [Meloidogyne graminicola]
MDKRKKKDKLSRKCCSEENPEKLTKEEDAIARCVRFNCPTNTTMFEGNEVKKAVDVLVESKKYGAGSKIKKFPDAQAAEYFLQLLLERGLFFRAKKTVLKKKDKETVEPKKGNKDGNKSLKIDKNEKEKVKEVGERDQNEDGGNKVDQDEDKKRKKKIKLTFNDLQTFEVETNDVYVWVFDPTPLWKQCVGVLMVLGTIGGCLFPLWPDWLRLGVYYLSLTGIILFGLYLGLALARTILFAIICVCSLGRHYLWVLPNLLEECGFFESFQPFYTYEYVHGGFFGQKTEAKKKDGANKKNKTDDNEISEREALIDPEVEPVAETEGEPQDNVVDESKKNSLNEINIEDEEEKEESVTDESTSWDKLSENSQRSSEENLEQQKND